MAELRIEKVVSALPTTLTPNTIYLVRSGAGFDIYVTNTTGTIVSYPINQAANISSYFEVMIWAEENAAISANQDEWSFGNGATGVIGIPSYWDCEAVGMVLDADIAGTSATVVLKIDGVPLATQFGITGTGEVNVTDFANPLPINRGQRIGFRTTTTSGTWTDVRVGVVLRVQI